MTKNLKMSFRKSTNVPLFPAGLLLSIFLVVEEQIRREEDTRNQHHKGGPYNRPYVARNIIVFYRFRGRLERRGDDGWVVQRNRLGVAPQVQRVVHTLHANQAPEIRFAVVPYPVVNQVRIAVVLVVPTWGARCNKRDRRANTKAVKNRATCASVSLLFKNHSKRGLTSYIRVKNFFQLVDPPVTGFLCAAPCALSGHVNWILQREESVAAVKRSRIDRSNSIDHAPHRR